MSVRTHPSTVVANLIEQIDVIASNPYEYSSDVDAVLNQLRSSLVVEYVNGKTVVSSTPSLFVAYKMFNIAVAAVLINGYSVEDLKATVSGYSHGYDDDYPTVGNLSSLNSELSSLLHNPAEPFAQRTYSKAIIYRMTILLSRIS